MQSKLNFAKKEYKIGDYFITATKTIKTALKVAIVKEAEHEDRKNEIQILKNRCLSIYRDMYPPLDTFEKIKKAFKDKPDFIEKTKHLAERIDYLENLEKDIINSDGGVIYCGETNSWAKIV
jgi:hypothetical protein